MKILIAEDDLVLRSLMEELLSSWGHETIVAEDGDAAVSLVRGHVGFDVAILDWMMPGTAGVDVCKDIRGLYVARHPYVIMLTAKAELRDVVEGLDAGADEYLTKPYRTEELAARVRAAARFMKVQDELIAARHVVAYQAGHDVLTGAINRATFLETLQKLLIERQEVPSPLSLVRVDIHGFRYINEVHGTKVGDDLLRAVYARIRTFAPAESTIARTGADEFLVLLRDSDEADAERRATDIARGVHAEPFPIVSGMLPLFVDAYVVSAATPTELDLGWILCSLDTLSSFGGVRPPRKDRYEPDVVQSH